jgi:hypothetical protein
MGVHWKHKPNVAAFTSPEPSPEAAYWAGFLLADGCVSTPPARLTVHLANQDVEHLKALAAFIMPTGMVKNMPDGSVQFHAYGADLIAALTRFGIVPRKSYGHPIPQIPNVVLPHFLRGYFDGDGWIGESVYRNWNDNPAYQFGVIGTPTWIRWIQRHLRMRCGVTGSLVPNGIVLKLSYGAARQVCAIIQYLDGQPRLERKWRLCDSIAAKVLLKEMLLSKEMV